MLQIIGVIGFVVYVSVFALVQLGMMNGNSVSYSLWNILAALCVAISLVDEFNLASALIQGSWIVIGSSGVMLRLRHRGANRLARAEDPCR